MRAALTAKFLFKLMSLLAVSLYLSLSTTAYAELTVKASVGYDYSSGDYGTPTTTEIESIPVTLSYTRGPWAGSVTVVPYISVTGNGTVVPGGGANPGSAFIPGSGSGSGSTVNNDGQGDTTLSLAYALFPADPTDTFIEFTGKAKLGTADASKGLGTGENDYSIQVDSYFGNGVVIPLVTIGYTIMGDTASIDYNNIFYGTIGAIFQTTETASFSILYDYQQTSVDGTDDFEQVGVYFDWQDPTLSSTSLGLIMGLSDNAPDVGISLIFSQKW